MTAPILDDEEGRVEALRRLGVLDTPPDERIDRITRLLAALLEVPISLVSLVDKDRQWFKSAFGLAQKQTTREVAFCAHAIHQSRPLIIPDARRDARFSDNPLVRGEPRVRFYAGAPLTTASGHRIGTLCAIDRTPRELSPTQLMALTELSHVVVDEIELAAAREALAEAAALLDYRHHEYRALVSSRAAQLAAPLRRIASLCEVLGSANPPRRALLQQVVTEVHSVAQMARELPDSTRFADATTP